MIFPGTPGMFSDANHAACSHIGKGPRGDGIAVNEIIGEGIYRLQFKNERTGEVYATTPNMYVSESDVPSEVRVTRIEKKTEPMVSPKSFGAVGDGIADDTQALREAFSSGKMVVCDPDAIYKVSPYIHLSNVDGTHVVGNGAQIVASIGLNNNTPIVEFTNSSNICLEGLDVHVLEDYSVSDLCSTGPYGIGFEGGENNCIVGCTVHNVKDGISVNNVTGLYILDNNVYHVGQEPCAIRFNKGCIVSGNMMHDHGGDGILCKFFNSPDYSNTIIVNNILSDGAHRPNDQSGGGITCNGEFVDNAYATKAVIIANNIVTNCRYGIIIGNAQECVVANNFCAPHTIPNQDQFYEGTSCYGVTAVDTDNPRTPNTIKNILFIGNVAIGGYAQFRTYRNVYTDVAPVKDIKFIGNLGREHPTAKSFMCIMGNNSTFISNDISCSGVRLGDSFGCDFIDNVLECTGYTAASPQESDFYFHGDDKVIAKGNTLKVRQIYINCNNCEFTDNSIYVQGTNSQPLKIGNSTLHIYFHRNSVDMSSVNMSQIYIADPSKMDSDIYRVRKADIVNDADSQVYGYILKDNKYTYISYDGPFLPNAFATIQGDIQFFKPPEWKKTIAIMRDINMENATVGRITLRSNEGKFYAMEYGNLGSGGITSFEMMFPNTKEEI